LREKIGSFIYLTIFLAVFGTFFVTALYKYFTSDWGDSAVEVTAKVTSKLVDIKKVGKSFLIRYLLSSPMITALRLVS